jgi:hypothetical protein
MLSPSYPAIPAGNDVTLWGQSPNAVETCLDPLDLQNQHSGQLHQFAEFTLSSRLMGPARRYVRGTDCRNIRSESRRDDRLQLEIDRAQ